MHQIQHRLKAGPLSSLAVRGGLCLKLLTDFAHDTVLLPVLLKLLWGDGFLVTLQPFWILKKGRRRVRKKEANRREGDQEEKTKAK